jgi:hypothetical protein
VGPDEHISGIDFFVSSRAILRENTPDCFGGLKSPPAGKAIVYHPPPDWAAKA